MSLKKIDLAPLLRFMETLPKSGDVELTLLKCHLLVEEALTKIISNSLKNPKYVSEAKLTFAQKIQLTRASTDLSHATWIWQALKLLNQARNKLSHNLTSSEIEEKLEIFITYVKSHNSEIPEEAISDKFSRFHWAVFATYTVVASHANFEPTNKTLVGSGNA